MFDVSFNQPVDYDFNTGIMNTNTMNRQGLPQENYTFTAIECKSIFSKGKFEQELTGKLLTGELKAPANTGTGRTATTPTAAASRTTGIPNDGSLGSEVVDETGQVSTLRRNEYGDLYDPAGTAGSALPTPRQELPTPRPASPPQPATSTGDIDYSTASALIPTAPTPVPRRNFGPNDIDYANQSALVPTRPQIIAKDE
jgi:hypothetical protein